MVFSNVCNVHEITSVHHGDIDYIILKYYLFLDRLLLCLLQTPLQNIDNFCSENWKLSCLKLSDPSKMSQQTLIKWYKFWTKGVCKFMVIGGLAEQNWLVVVLLILVLSYYLIIWLLPWVKLWYLKMMIFPVHTREWNVNLFNSNWGESAK